MLWEKMDMPRVKIKFGTDTDRWFSTKDGKGVVRTFKVCINEEKGITDCSLISTE